MPSTNRIMFRRFSVTAAFALAIIVNSSSPVLAQGSPPADIKNAVSVLLDILTMEVSQEPEKEVLRATAAVALGKIPTAAPDLVRVVRDKMRHDAARRSAIDALRRIGPEIPASIRPAAVRALIAIMAEKKDDDLFMNLAIKAMGRICS